MIKVVNANIVAANAFLTTKQDVLEKELIKKYVDKVREKTNYKTDFFIGGFDTTLFAKQYDFIFNIDKCNENIYILTDVKDRRVLKGYFRRGLPKKFIEILKETGKELIEEQLEVEKQKQLIKKV